MTESDKIGRSHRFDKFENLTQYHQVKLSRERRVLIPAAVRAELGIGEGTNLSLAAENGEIRLFDRARALERARDIARKYRLPGKGVVDELLRERRDETGRE